MPDKRKYYLEKAESFKCALNYSEKKPVNIVCAYMDKSALWKYEKIGNADEIEKISLDKGGRICLDFGTHCVGYVSFDISYTGSPPDAPAYLRIKFGEHICEIGENSEDYTGELSPSWIQEEYLHIDVIPSRVTLPRRYAFRFMEIYVKGVSKKFNVRVSNVICKTVTSADMTNIQPLKGASKEITDIDYVSLKTMRDCMQDVFEDGPKRDRRLWIGDLRLQALTNYYTFKNDNLVKRCMYLFAGAAKDNGAIPACLYTKPHVLADDIFLFDYSLFFISCLHDYYFATNDKEVLDDLWEVAYRQIELSAMRIGDNGIVKDSTDWWCFIDWNDDLNKQSGAQAIFIYTLKQALSLAKVCADSKEVNYIESLIEKLTEASLSCLWDNEQGFFVSGSDKQVSWATQVWFVMAQVLDDEKNRGLILNLIGKKPKIKMNTPYMYHHFTQACMLCGMKNTAVDIIKSYWGEMVKDGADCFYEVYDPENKNHSPYASAVINSYCHAWSATPSYFIRKYNLK